MRLATIVAREASLLDFSLRRGTVAVVVPLLLKGRQVSGCVVSRGVLLGPDGARMGLVKFERRGIAIVGPDGFVVERVDQHGFSVRGQVFEHPIHRGAQWDEMLRRAGVMRPSAPPPVPVETPSTATVRPAPPTQVVPATPAPAPAPASTPASSVVAPTLATVLPAAPPETVALPSAPFRDAIARKPVVAPAVVLPEPMPPSPTTIRTRSLLPSETSESIPERQPVAAPLAASTGAPVVEDVEQATATVLTASESSVQPGGASVAMPPSGDLRRGSPMKPVVLALLAIIVAVGLSVGLRPRSGDGHRAPRADASKTRSAKPLEAAPPRAQAVASAAVAETTPPATPAQPPSGSALQSDVKPPSPPVKPASAPPKPVAAVSTPRPPTTTAPKASAAKPVKGAQASTHTVRVGETLHTIARQYGVRGVGTTSAWIEACMRLNGLRDANALLVGRPLKLPSNPPPPWTGDLYSPMRYPGYPKGEIPANSP